jgi:hypothetical protein
MRSSKTPSRQELVEACEKIRRQVNELNRRFAATVGYPSPDNRALVATLEEELKELSEALARLDA